jgi:hypothetical protein
MSGVLIGHRPADGVCPSGLLFMVGKATGVGGAPEVVREVRFGARGAPELRLGSLPGASALRCDTTS